MIGILAHYALRDLSRVKLRTFFTLFVISLVFALFILLTSIGQELSSQISTTISEKQIDIIVQSRFSSTPFSSAITQTDADGLRTYPGISDLTSLLIGKKRIDKTSSLFLLGFSDFTPIAKRLGLGLVKGKVFRPASREIAIGRKVARILKLDVGDSITLDDQEAYTITGIYSTGLDFLDACAYIGIDHAQRLLGRPEHLSMLFITLKEPQETKTMIKTIDADFPKLIAFTSGELLQHLGSTKTIVQFITLISVITFIIATVVLLNTLIMSVNERTKEIGILSAIGWSRAMIITMFTIEAMILSLSGGVLGFLLTYPAISMLDRIPSMGLNFIPHAPSSEMFGILMLACIVIGLLSALFPALYGTRMLPAKALHHE